MSYPWNGAGLPVAENKWTHFAVVNNNYNVSVYLDGEVVGGIYCPLNMTAPPLWQLGIRDWSTDPIQTNTLQPVYPFYGDMAEFRAWTRPLSQAELVSKMHRTLTPAETADPNLLVYLDLGNVTNGVAPDLSAKQRLKGYLGGVLHQSVNVPPSVPVSAPVVNLRLNNVLPLQMKESGDYKSILTVPITAVSATDNSSSLVNGANATSFILQSLPDPKVLILSTVQGGPAITAQTMNIGSVGVLYATHVADLTVASWPVQKFNVTVTSGKASTTLQVVITILKNAAPLIGNNGGAIVPSNAPAAAAASPLIIPSFAWLNASFAARPLTWEMWIVPGSDQRTFASPLLEQLQGYGRFSFEDNAHFVFDYGWIGNNGRNVGPDARNHFGLWTHIAMISDGVDGGFNKLYVNGQLVSTAGAASGPLAAAPIVSNATGFAPFALAGNLAMDELRMWNTNKSIEDVRATMYTRLNGNEKNLYMYHNFDTHTVQGGKTVFKDLGPHGFDAYCTDFDGVSPCPLVPSQAPIGGLVNDLYFKDGDNFTLWDPVGVDIDDDTMYLRFVVDTVTIDASMMYDTNHTYRRMDGDLRQGIANMQYTSPVSAGSYLRREMFEPSVKIIGTTDGGGSPYDSFTYHVTDGLRNSPQKTINIHRRCAPGTYHVPANKKCIACPVGTYQPAYGWSTTCLPCAAGSAQNATGQITCNACTQAVFVAAAPTNSTSTNATLSSNTTLTVNVNSTSAAQQHPTLPVVSIGTTQILSFGSFQDQQGQATCNACPDLSYALTASAVTCGGQAFIPSYVSYALGSSNEGRDELQGAVSASAFTAAPKGVIVAAIVLAILTALTLFGLYFFHANPVVKASSPIFMTIIGAGIIAGCFSVVPYSLRPTNATCIAEIWMFPIPFSIVIGSLISKTFRIMRIFNNPKALKITITNTELFGYTIVAVAINSAILLCWTLIDPPVPTIIQRGNSNGLIFEGCSSKSSVVQLAFTAVLFAYNIILLAILSALSYFTKNVFALFSESKYIFYFVAVTSGCVAIFISLLYLPSNDLTAIYAIKSIAVLIICAAAWTFILAVKFMLIYQRYQRGDDETKKTATVNSQMNAPLLGGNEEDFEKVVGTWMKDQTSVMSAECAIKVKKFGVDFWEQKTALLMLESKILVLVGVEVKTGGKQPAKTVPQSLFIPLTRFTVEAGAVGAGKDTQMTDATASAGTASKASDAPGPAGGTTITLTLDNGGRTVVIQFNSTTSMRDFSIILKKIQEGKAVAMPVAAGPLKSTQMD
ncbi:hypothetical protein HK101_010102 [Irineochytrium annulatum]|nr:hypothetical protein HK101_010102 [Irineochytrium annulatum]